MFIVGLVILLFSKFLFDLITERHIAVILFDIYTIIGFPLLFVKMIQKEKERKNQNA